MRRSQRARVKSCGHLAVVVQGPNPALVYRVVTATGDQGAALYSVGLTELIRALLKSVRAPTILE
jgi:hypothetical protein